MNARVVTGMQWLAWCLLPVAILLASGCRGGKVEPPYKVATGGDPTVGRKLIASYCASCHTVPGVRGARGRVAPPLHFFAERTFIAGAVPNTPENLVKWIQDPQLIEPHTAMPDLGLTRQQAQDIAAYLLSLR